MLGAPCAAIMACMWHFVSGWRCGRTDSGGRLPSQGGRSGDDHSGSPIVARRENLWCTVRSACRVASKNSRAGDRVGAAEGISGHEEEVQPRKEPLMVAFNALAN